MKRQRKGSTRPPRAAPLTRPLSIYAWHVHRFWHVQSGREHGMVDGMASEHTCWSKGVCGAPSLTRALFWSGVEYVGSCACPATVAVITSTATATVAMVVLFRPAAHNRTEQFFLSGDGIARSITTHPPVRVCVGDTSPIPLAGRCSHFASHAHIAV